MSAADARGVSPRELDVVVLGATGLTGRLVAARLLADAPATGVGTDDAGGLRWGVAGRDRGRLQAVLDELGAPQVPTIVADVTDPASLAALAARTTVVLNLAGPYTPAAEAVIDACVQAGTSYADLSGEIPLLQRVNRRFDTAAAHAGVAVVQMAGWEALPADLAILLACREAARSGSATGEDACGSSAGDGPGANHPVQAVHVTMSFDRTPGGGRGRGQAVSGGTLASIVTMIEDEGAAALGDPAAFLPVTGSPDAVRKLSPLRMRPRTRAGRHRGPFVPVAFLDPPILHRTAALLAQDRGAPHQPAMIDEGNDLGPTDRPGARRVVRRATGLAALQRGLIVVARSPRPLRRLFARAVDRWVPASGEGPSGRSLTDWSWTVRAEATTADGAAGSATMTGTGHPGYTATAAMIVAVGRHLAATSATQRRSGCLTPALAFGADGALSALTSDHLRLRAG